MIVVYGIFSKNKNRIYIGHTNTLDKRLKYHNSGYVKSTKSGRPWKIVAIEEFDNRSEARWKERQLKESKGVRDRWLQCNRV